MQKDYTTVKQLIYKDSKCNYENDSSFGREFTEFEILENKIKNIYVNISSIEGDYYRGITTGCLSSRIEEL